MTARPAAAAAGRVTSADCTCATAAVAAEATLAARRATAASVSCLGSSLSPGRTGPPSPGGAGAAWQSTLAVATAAAVDAAMLLPPPLQPGPAGALAFPAVGMVECPVPQKRTNRESRHAFNLWSCAETAALAEAPAAAAAAPRCRALAAAAALLAATVLLALAVVTPRNHSCNAKMRYSGSDCVLGISVPITV
jgi:hypothetical protein